MKRIVFLEQSIRVIFHAVLMASRYLLFAGHNQPGGGFVGGLVAGAAISLRYLAGGLDEVRGLDAFRPWTILATGVVIATATALAPSFAGKPIMDSLGTTMQLPIVGHVYVSSTLVFDIGVYLVVIGLVFMVFEAFGGDDPDDPEPEVAS